MLIAAEANLAGNGGQADDIRSRMGNVEEEVAGLGVRGVSPIECVQKTDASARRVAAGLV